MIVPKIIGGLFIFFTVIALAGLIEFSILVCGRFEILEENADDGLDENTYCGIVGDNRPGRDWVH